MYIYTCTVVTCMESCLIKYNIHAKMFSGKGKGTPSLKNGVRCIEVIQDPDDSDAATDWKGF